MREGSSARQRGKPARSFGASPNSSTATTTRPARKTSEVAVSMPLAGSVGDTDGVGIGGERPERAESSGRNGK